MILFFNKKYEGNDKYMVNMNEVIELSVVIANNFDNIDELTSNIHNRIINDPLNKDTYSFIVNDVIDNKKKLENLILLNKEYFKQFLLKIKNICDNFDDKCTDIKLKVDKKDSINKGRYVNPISLISSDINSYYTLDKGTPTESNNEEGSNLNSMSMILDSKIESKKIEEIGSIDNLLHNYLHILCNDISWIKYVSSALVDISLEKSKYSLEDVNNIMDTIRSYDIINCINNIENENCNNIPNIMVIIDNFCKNIKMYSKTFKNILMKIVKILKVLEIDINVQVSSLNKYVISESLL